MINTAQGTVDGWMHPDLVNATWDHDRNPDTPEVPWPDIQKRHVNGVRRIDDAVGDLVQLLKDLGIENDTLIVFTSDNGPAREANIPGVDYDPDFLEGFGPFTGIKRDVLEGGVRVPTLVRWTGHIPEGRTVHDQSAMWDWMPTFAELAGLPPPASSDGISLVPTLVGTGQQRPSTIYVEYFNNQKTPAYSQFPADHRGRTRRQMQLIMLGGYTGVRYNIQSANDDFEIYDVSNDPRQANNLAHKPELAALQQQMKTRVLQLRRPNASAPRPYDDAFVPAVTPPNLQPGKILRQAYHGNWPWVPHFAMFEPAHHLVVSNFTPPQASDDGMIGLAFTGYFHAPAEGDYTFHITSDGGAVLFLHDARVIDDDFNHDGTTVSSTIRLAAGWHPLRLYTRHSTPQRRLSVEYAGPGISRQSIPAEALAIARD